MEDRLWDVLGDRYGARRDAPESWQLGWATGLQDMKTDPVFDPIGGVATIGAIDDLLGVGRWQRPGHWGQMLVSFPPPEGQRVPAKSLWHMDFAYDTPPDQLSGVLVFSFISTVSEESGGTAVISGSHRLVREFVKTQRPEVLAKMKTARKALLRSAPWLVELNSGDEDPDWLARLVGSEHVLAGIPLRIEALGGAPGDVVITHPWLLHSPAPNRGAWPRLMRVQRIHIGEG